jgi:hypothetical protein
MAFYSLNGLKAALKRSLRVSGKIHSDVAHSDQTALVNYLSLGQKSDSRSQIL